MKEAFLGMCAMLVAIMLFATPFMALTYFAEAASCRAHWKDSGYESQYGLWSDCRVKINGHWVPEGIVRKVQP